MKRFFHSVIALLFIFTVYSALPVQACRAPKASAQMLISEAEIILRATAVKYIQGEPSEDNRALNEPENTEIKFKVEEVLKGEKVPSAIILNGYLTDKDDYNEFSVPFDFVRKGGRGGSCSAYEYKKNAEFLLFLKKKDGKYTIRWYPLAPTNEQIHSKDDAWVLWVKNYLQSQKEK